MKAFALGTMLLCGALAACSSSGGDSTGTGTGSGGSDAGSGGSDAGSGGESGTPSAQGTGSTGNTTATTTGGGTCGADVSEDPACNTCGTTACCAQVEACYLDPANSGCFDPETGALDPDSAGGGNLIACLETNCEAECFGAAGGGVCDSGISFGNEDGSENVELNECLTAACCDEFTACTVDGTDVDSCIACLQGGGGPLCDAALTCAEENCFSDICDTGIGFGDEAIDECLSEACCTEYTTCIGDGSDTAIQDCLDCLNSEAGGPLCEDAITCTNESGCVPEQ